MPVEGRAPMNPPALLTDLYQLTMLQAYFAEGMTETAVFDLFVRRLPEKRNYLVACGIESVLDYLENLRFESGDIEYLAQLGLFTHDFLDHLSSFRFGGDVYAMREGSVFFAGEPIIEVIAPLPQAQLVETYLLNQITFQSVAATKASRVVTAARDRPVVDFGLRRMHGADAGLDAARSFYVAGVDATSNVLAGRIHGIPVAGTMAHSYIEAHANELEAFRSFARSYAETVLLVDTYETAEGIANVIRLAHELGPEFNVRGVRLDSGDLAFLAASAREQLDAAGLNDVEIFASSSLDEYEIERLLDGGAPIDGFGVGTKMGVSEDAPYLDSVYKLVSFDGEGRMKLSPEKTTVPHCKQVFRNRRSETFTHDVIAMHDEKLPGDPLLRKVMKSGRRLDTGFNALGEARDRRENQVRSLPEEIRSIGPASQPYRIEMSRRLSAEMLALQRLRAGVASPSKTQGETPFSVNT